MAKYRSTRINEEVAKVITEALRTVKDPRVASQFITITSCNVTNDLKFAKVYYSLFDVSEENLKETKQGLRSASGYIRSQLAQKLNLRITPELTFIYDDGPIKSTRINEILKNISEENKVGEDNEDQ